MTPYPPPVTVIMRTKNVAGVVGQALDGLFAQDYGDFELLVVDSGSTDDTLDVVSQYEARVEHLAADSYVPGRVLNRAIAGCGSPVVVFQNSDAVPLHQQALSALLAPFDDADVDATFGRQLPRPEAQTWVRGDYERAFPAMPPPPAWLPYSLPFAAMRRSAWVQRPFYDAAWGSEDTEWGVAAARDARLIEYVPEAAVMHSHNYTLRQLFGRRFIEGEADAFIYGAASPVASALRAWAGAMARDAWQHTHKRDWIGLLQVPLRRAVFHGAYVAGHRHGRRRIAARDTDVGFGQRVVLERYHG